MRGAKAVALGPELGEAWSVQKWGEGRLLPMS